MIRINQIKLPINHSEQQLKDKIKKMLKLKSDDFNFRILKRSIDARKKPDIVYSYSIIVETGKDEKIVNKLHNPSISIYKEKKYSLPDNGEENIDGQPVVIGAGPAGLFCAYILSMKGFKPIVIERGSSIDKRKLDVEKFWQTGIIVPDSNVQFGEGGAGTFSDGKLNTSVKDPSGRNKFVLETFVEFGAQSNILYDNKPHIGTDVLSDVIVNIRKYLVGKGCRFMFDTKAYDFEIEDNTLTAIKTSNGLIRTNVCILALGHSARDTFFTLNGLGIDMQAKNFAVGFRVEHPQKMINEAMYGKNHDKKLCASPYKVTSNFPNGRGVYSFCMCPGGYVVNSSSDDKGTVVNGMSYSGRNGKNANSAIIVSVGVNDFGASDALAGVRFQEKLEKENFMRGNGKIPQQLFGDFCQNVETSAYGEFDSQTKGSTVFTKLNGLMNKEMEESFILGMQHFSHIVPGFDRKDAILSGMETRTSSPIRMVRDENLESNIKGMYPCGEGAGYAGGITSAAIDGIKIAEAIIKKYRPN